MTDAYIMAAALLPSLGQLLAIGAGLALAAWAIGGIVLRLGGSAVVIVGLVAAALAHPAGLLLAASGALLWAVGHWHYALRHHAYRSPLARRIFLQLLPSRFDPARRWATPTTTTPPTRTTP